MGIDKTAALADIDGVLKDAANPPITGGSETVEYGSALYAECIRRLTPPQSRYRDAIDRTGERSFMTRHKTLLGTVHALRADITADRLLSFEEAVHAALFSDLLSSADQLLADNFLLPAAVMAGATLEEHLRQLASKHGIAVVVEKNGRSKHKEASAVNDELYAQKRAYSKGHHALIQGWLHMRNEAAHANVEFQKRTNNEIGQMIAGIRELIVGYPA